MSAPDASESRPRPSSRFWWALSSAALVFGFADLARGGITIAAVLLVLAYCVLIPIAILK
jgi:hypothetical protein